MPRRTRPQALPAAPAVCLIVLGISLVGCGNPCRKLCVEWHTYRESVCMETVRLEERSRCIEDYRPADSDERADCNRGLEEIQTLLAEENNACCYIPEAKTCPSCVERPQECTPPDVTPTPTARPTLPIIRSPAESPTE